MRLRHRLVEGDLIANVVPPIAIVAPHCDNEDKKSLFHLTIFTMFSLNFVAMDLTEKQSAQEPRRPDDRQNVKHYLRDIHALVPIYAPTIPAPDI